MDYDVLIVGAGPAGSMTAGIIARAGFSVLMIDRKLEIGVPVQCAEYIPALLVREVEIPFDTVAQRIKGLRVYFPDEASDEFSTPGYILNRALFDKYLALNAIKNGAHLWLKTRFIGIDGGKPLVRHNGKVLKINARIVVGADGPNSLVSRLVNPRYIGYVVAYQQELPLMGTTEYNEVYFDKEFFGGYAWLFPKNHRANVGVGVKTGWGINPQKIFKYFVQKLAAKKKIIDTPLKVITGLIPVSGPVLNTVKDNIVLVGDAAGQTHPITGAGIPQAIICGKYAGESIVKALKNDDLKLLKIYEERWRNLYKDELERALEKRKLMEENWTKFESILKECWVSFPEYYG